MEKDERQSGGLDARQLHERMRELADRLMTMARDTVDYQQVRFESRLAIDEAPGDYHGNDDRGVHVSR